MLLRMLGTPLEEETSQPGSPEYQEDVCNDFFYNYLQEKKRALELLYQPYHTLDCLTEGDRLLTQIKNAIEAVEQAIDRRNIDHNDLSKKIETALATVRKFDQHMLIELPETNLPLFRFDEMSKNHLDILDDDIKALNLFKSTVLTNEQAELYHATQELLLTLHRKLCLHRQIYNDFSPKKMIDEPSRQLEKFTHYQLRLNRLIKLASPALPLNFFSRIKLENNFLEEPAEKPRASCCAVM